MKASAVSSLIVRLALTLRVCGLGEVATLRLLLYIASKPAFGLLKARQEPQKFFFSNRVRTDGGGSQVLYAFFALSVANRAGIPYRHRSFSTIEHSRGDREAFTRRWNKAFDFSAALGSADNLPVFSLGSRVEVLRALTSQSNTIGLTSHRFRDITDEHPEILEFSRAELKKIFAPEAAEMSDAAAPSGVWFHLRRGDVTATTHPGRFTTLATVLRDAKVVLGVYFSESAPKTVVGQIDQLERGLLAKAGFETTEDDDALESLNSLARAPVLVTGVSSFSYLAALLSSGTVVYRDFWHPPMSDWVSLSTLHELTEDATAST